MKVAELRDALADYPDDAEVSILLDPSGTDLDIEDIHVTYTGREVSKATNVHLGDRAPEPIFDGQIRLGLTHKFLVFCHDHKVTPEQVLYGFMADLAELRGLPDGMNTNGSDERMYAQQYFERCPYAWPDGE